MPITTRTSTLLLVIVFSTASGCFLFHKESPQQQYTEALMRGNSMQASQLWLNMSPDDRMKFARGEGFKPDESTKKDVQKMMMNHYQDEAGEDSNAGEHMQERVPTPLGASLKDLPAASESSSPTK
jgi:redox-sensitive bicupin YhaK (pirin superfamily)